MRWPEQVTSGLSQYTPRGALGDDVTVHLGGIGRKDSLPDWRFRRGVDALQTLFASAEARVASAARDGIAWQGEPAGIYVLVGYVAIAANLPLYYVPHTNHFRMPKPSPTPSVGLCPHRGLKRWGVHGVTASTHRFHFLSGKLQLEPHRREILRFLFKISAREWMLGKPALGEFQFEAFVRGGELEFG